MKDYGLKLACQHDIEFIKKVAKEFNKPFKFWPIARAIIKSNKKIQMEAQHEGRATRLHREG